MSLLSLNHLFLVEMRGLYDMETQIVRAWPSLISNCSSAELKDAFTKLLEDQGSQMQRLDKIFSFLNEMPDGVTCHGMTGLIKECSFLQEQDGESMVKDAALIMSGQKVAHYAIAAYGAARTHARHLGYDQPEKLLQKSLDEKGAGNKDLTHIAEGTLFSHGVNQATPKY